MFEHQTILITGAHGYIGSNLVSLLKESACRVIRVTRHEPVFEPVVGSCQVDDIQADVRDPELWSRVLPGVDVVFHLAAQTSTYVANENPHADVEANVTPMLNLLHACRVHALSPTVIFAGTVTQAGLPTALPVDESHRDEPVTAYDVHKLMAEQYLKYYVREGVVRGASVRLANVYGPGPESTSADRGVLNMMIRNALDGHVLAIHGTGEFTRDYIYVKDVANAFVAAAQAIDHTNGRHFVIGSGVGRTIAEAIHCVADRVALSTGRKVEVAHVDPPATQSIIEQRNFVADTSAFTKATGWTPRVTLNEGIDQTVEAWVA